MANTVSFHMTMPQWQAHQLIYLYGSRQAGVRAAVAMLLSEGRRSSRAARFQEVHLQARSGGSVDTLLEVLAAGAATLGDLSPSGESIDRSLQKAIEDALSPKPARRVLRRLQGASITTIGKEDGVTKQAVHKSLRLSQQILATNRDFVVALCDLFPESGLTPDLLMEVSFDRSTL